MLAAKKGQQQYNAREELAPLYCTLYIINRHAGNTKQNREKIHDEPGNSLILVQHWLGLSMIGWVSTLYYAVTIYIIITNH